MTMVIIEKMMAILDCHTDADDLLLQLQLLRIFFYDAAKFPPRETTIAATMAT